MTDKLTVCVFTNLVPSCPSLDLIKRTISSFPVHGCRVIVAYDRIDRSDRSTAYGAALLALFPETIIVDNGMQRRTFLAAIERVTTPYFLQLEHDWELLKQVDFSKIIEAMDKNKRINAVYFNKRANFGGHDDGKMREILTPAADLFGIPLLKTSRWTNNPGIIRTEKYQKEWIPMFKNKDLIYPDKRNKQIEPYIHWPYIDLIKQRGFDNAHALYGTYIYGKITDAPMVKHLDGRTYK
jgi:hypothetical protein